MTMSAPKNCVDVLVLSASLRSDSLNGRLASLALDAVQRHDGTGTVALMSDFDCPSFDQDDESASGVPEAAQRFCDRLKATDAIIISSPEYNASMPGALKNLIDWTSRVRPQPFNGKQALLLSASPSMAGGNRGLWALRVPLEHLGMRVYPDMFSLAQAHQAFGTDGRIANETLQKRFDQVIGCFMDLVEAAKHYPGLKKQWVEFLGEHPDHATDRVEVAETAAA
jgi:chromate reductase